MLYTLIPLSLSLWPSWLWKASPFLKILPTKKQPRAIYHYPITALVLFLLLSPRTTLAEDRRHMQQSTSGDAQFEQQRSPKDIFATDRRWHKVGIPLHSYKLVWSLDRKAYFFELLMYLLDSKNCLHPYIIKSWIPKQKEYGGECVGMLEIQVQLLGIRNITSPCVAQGNMRIREKYKFLNKGIWGLSHNQRVCKSCVHWERKMSSILRLIGQFH